jgi:two-component system, OmpR family, sensor kinase
MSLQSGFSRRWQKVRRASGRVPLRIKLISAVLALVFIALGAISFGGITLLRNYLLAPYDSILLSAGTQHEALRATERCLVAPSPCPQPATGGGMVDWLPANGSLQQVLVPVQPQFVIQPSLANITPGPAIPGSPGWAASLTGQTVTVPSQSGGGHWRLTAFPTQFTNNVTGQTTNGTIIVGFDVSSVYRTLDGLALIDLIVSAVVLVALAIAGIAIVRSSLRPLTDIELTAEAIAAGDLSRRVPDRDPRTEVGRLGRSLNTMLAQVEAAFHAREKSEAAARWSEERMRQFVADASHELRTPLTAIRGYAEYYRQRGGSTGNGARHALPASTEPGLAADSPLSEPDVDRIMQRVEQESARMGVLVEDMLLLARLDQQRPIERRPVDLLSLAGDAVQDARMIAPNRKIELTVGNGAAFLILGDEARLRQVISNLMSNALTHTPDGTPIDVRILAHGPDGRLPVPSVTLEVDDHGPGLSQEQADRVFERFYRADQARRRKTGGTGLGLAIVYALVAAHGGTTGVDTAPGDGATFWITLPLAAEAT